MLIQLQLKRNTKDGTFRTFFLLGLLKMLDLYRLASVGKALKASLSHNLWYLFSKRGFHVLSILLKDWASEGSDLRNFG